MPEKTYVIQIGNSDDKLPQAEWAAFISDLHAFIVSTRAELHFSGASNPVAHWQNYCWVLVLDDAMITPLKTQLEYLARKYHQSSIAITTGITTFITPL